MPGPKDITLTLSMEDYNNLQAAKAKAEQETFEALKQLEIAKGVDGDARVAKIAKFARHCLEIARFAVANCPPEAIKGWPYEDLRALCATIEALPDYGPNDQSMAMDLLEFAADCEERELFRRGVAQPKRQVVKLPPVDTSAHDV